MNPRWLNAHRNFAVAAIWLTSGVPASMWPSGWASFPSCGSRGYVFREARAVDRHGHRIASIKPSAIMGSGQRYVSIARSDLAAVIYEALAGRVELILDDTVQLSPTTAIGFGSNS